MSLSLWKPFIAAPYCGKIWLLPTSLLSKKSSPYFLCNHHTGLLVDSQTCQDLSYLKAFALVLSLACNTIFFWLAHSHPSGLCLNVTSSGRPSLFTPSKIGHPSLTFYYRTLFISSIALFIIKLIIFTFLLLLFYLFLVSLTPSGIQPPPVS